jgi:hypothetical protein
MVWNKVTECDRHMKSETVLNKLINKIIILVQKKKAQNKEVTHKTIFIKIDRIQCV